jgi:uncharacterized protein YjbI with pentapeptide repeats
MLNTNFEKANLTSSDFTKVIAKNCIFTKSKLINSDMREGDFEHSNFNEANMYQVNLQMANL